MAETKRKGDIGEAMVMADVLKRGYKVAIPIGEDWRFDLIVQRNSRLERVQCKYTKSDGKKILAKNRSCNNWSDRIYNKEDIDWLAVYDATSQMCYYINAERLNGRSTIFLRLEPPINGQKKKILWAKDFVEF